MIGHLQDMVRRRFTEYADRKPSKNSARQIFPLSKRQQGSGNESRQRQAIRPEYAPGKGLKETISRQAGREK
jgi:hypothetical protein